MRRDVFQAIADPTRREIIDLIAFKALTLNAIADNFEISRSAVSQHIKILTECGLVAIQKNGRQRICHVKFRNLSDVSNWLEQYRIFWTNKLDALEVHLTENEINVKPKR
ncbi:MAG: ArsR family transcriptional regulator [Chitinophagaceae bacterium]|nr:MAG: ArsR family transcriptional regulator [Chitinophagaceae bacterium]